ncbi:MAG: ubiquinol-cytochrome c reductase iron-sulfur subunit, partial [Gammaproteobacteria bacterium]
KGFSKEALSELKNIWDTLSSQASHVISGLDSTNKRDVDLAQKRELKLDKLAASGRLVDPNSEMPQQPEYCKNKYRSQKDEFLVVVGICTHLGCSPTFRPDAHASDLGADWPGGYFCPCHGSRFDFAGRVFKSMPAPKNLVIPPHKYLSDTTVLIGVDPEVA